MIDTRKSPRQIRADLATLLNTFLSSKNLTLGQVAERFYIEIGFGAKSSAKAYLNTVRNGFCYNGRTDYSRDLPINTTELKHIDGLLMVITDVKEKEKMINDAYASNDSLDSAML